MTQLTRGKKKFLKSQGNLLVKSNPSQANNQAFHHPIQISELGAPAKYRVKVLQITKETKYTKEKKS